MRAQPDVGSVVVVKFTYNSLLETVQARADNFGDFAYFGVDTLVYAAVAVPMTVAYNFTMLSSFDKASIMQALQNETLSYMNPQNFVSVMQPEAFIANLQKNVPSAIQIDLLTFTTKNSSTVPIQTVQFTKVQYPVLSQIDMIINLRS